MTQEISPETYGEFKGSTSAKLEIIFNEIKGLRQDVNDLKTWKAWTLGAGAVAGLVAGFLRDIIIRKI